MLQGGNVSTDEYGTSILRYIDQFGGYDAPSIEDAIAAYTDGVLPDETPGPTDPDPVDPDPVDPDPVDPDPVDPDPVEPDPVEPAPATGNDFANAAITAQNATVAINWQWGRVETISDFDPDADTIHIAWVGADSLNISESANGVTFAIPSNNQSVTLAGVSFADLSPDLVNALETSVRDALAAVVSGDMGGDGDGHGDGGDGHGGDGHDHAHQMIDLTLTSPSRTIDDFDPSTDMVHIGAGITADRFEMFE